MSSQTQIDVFTMDSMDVFWNSTVCDFDLDEDFKVDSKQFGTMDIYKILDSSDGKLCGIALVKQQSDSEFIVIEIGFSSCSYDDFIWGILRLGLMEEFKVNEFVDEFLRTHDRIPTEDETF